MLAKNFLIDGKYKVLFPIKKGSNAETYRVKGKDGKLYFVKIFDYERMHPSAFDDNNNLLEVAFHKMVKHPNLASYKEDGKLIIGGKEFGFLVLDFIVGETLKERITREPLSTVYDVKQIITGILNGLSYLHSLPEAIIHNEITPDNIMLDLSGDIPQPKIIDLGYARPMSQTTKEFNKKGLDFNYVASECFQNVYSPPSDIFSVGATMYHLLFGLPPWHVDTSKYADDPDQAQALVLGKRNKPLALLNVGHSIVDLDDSMFIIIKKALLPDPIQRYQSANEFIEALATKKLPDTPANLTVGATPYSKEVDFSDGPKGFSAIAGMSQLKEQLQHDVINAIENQEEYRKHNLSLPNGMLLYGPPGCGKTFFAERFAEQAGYNFIKVISSDLASIYVHGSQEKIGKLFKEARLQAPTILYFDEIDAMIPDREKVNTHSQSSEVNEFLSQLDNIGDSGIFVIGSTNKPDLLDKAALRAGRLEKWFHVPPPDLEARRAMFELYLKDRPIDESIDYEKLASTTENYVSSDIKLIVDEASRQTIRYQLGDISMDTLNSVLERQKPTVSLDELQKHENVRKEFEKDKSNQRPRIGF